MVQYRLIVKYVYFFEKHFDFSTDILFKTNAVNNIVNFYITKFNFFLLVFAKNQF